jgi:DNA adenine methylase
MSITATVQRPAKPFLKWAGGKGQLIDEIDNRLPEELKASWINTYVEPFVGGGAIFFHSAQKYDSIKHFYLFDINPDLVNCYNTIKKDVENLIKELRTLEKQFLQKDIAEKRDFYYQIREQFNRQRSIARLIFLNKTCYNGLYRVNKKGDFNVPFGDYKNPKICNPNNLRNASQLLQNAEIICGDFEKSATLVDAKTFVYFDPPYRPLGPTASFTSYTKQTFGEYEQVRLARFCKLRRPLQGFLYRPGESL